MNGRWTLQHEDALEGSRADYYFDVSISGVDERDLAPLNITSPRPGSTISRTPTFVFESEFNLDRPDDGAGIIFEILDVERVNDGRCTFTTPLRDGTYGAGIELFRDRPITDIGDVDGTSNPYDLAWADQYETWAGAPVVPSFGSWMGVALEGGLSQHRWS